MPLPDRARIFALTGFLPAGVVLSSVAVTGERIVADVDIAGTINSDPAMQEKGVCG